MKKRNNNTTAASTAGNMEDRALDRFAEMMIEKIETIKADWRKPWFTEGSLRWPENLSGRKYNGGNAMMLMMHCEKEGYKHPVFATFKSVLNLSLDKDGNPMKNKDGSIKPMVSVQKGEKSFPVFLTTFTVKDKDTGEKIDYEDYKKLDSTERERYNVFPRSHVYNVFNIDQTNMREVRPDLYQKYVDNGNAARISTGEGEDFKFAPLDELVENNKWLCPVNVVYQDSAYYSVSDDKIVVPTKEQFESVQSWSSTLLHEMAHSTGAESRLGRLSNNRFGDDGYAREELVAELSAAMVCSHYGFATTIKEESAAYLKSWLGSLRQSPDYIKTTLNDVKRATAMITEHLDRAQERINARTEEMTPDVAKTESMGEEQATAAIESLQTQDDIPAVEATEEAERDRIVATHPLVEATQTQPKPVVETIRPIQEEVARAIPTPSINAEDQPHIRRGR
jgi:antirestriction protein ArdC